MKSGKVPTRDPAHLCEAQKSKPPHLPSRGLTIARKISGGTAAIQIANREPSGLQTNAAFGTFFVANSSSSRLGYDAKM